MQVAGGLGLSKKNEFRKRFKLALRREWYPTLKALKETKFAPQREELLGAWNSLGNAMNLDETLERQEYERESKRAADRRCSWRQCEYHTKKPPKTRVCIGCDEAVSTWDEYKMLRMLTAPYRGTAPGHANESASAHSLSLARCF